MAILAGIAIAAATVLGSELVSKLGVNRTFESTALLALGTFFGTFMFVVSGGLIGVARAQRTLQKKLESALGEEASREAKEVNRETITRGRPGRSLSPNQQAILGLVGTIVTALLGFLGVVLQLLTGSGGSGG